MQAITVASSTIFVEHITRIDWNVPLGITGQIVDRLELDAHNRYEITVIAPEARKALREALANKCISVPPLLEQADERHQTDH